MKTDSRTLSVAFILFASAVTWSAANQTAPAKPVVTMELDRTNAVYACGDVARFQIAVTDAGQAAATGSVNVTWTRDARTEIGKASVSLENGSVTLARTLDQPGFLTCHVSYAPPAGDAVKRRVCVAFSPERIGPGQQEPPDFDTFWAASRKELESIPLDAVVTPLPKESRATYDACKISLANIHGTRAWGFLTVPKGKPAPLLISVPGANLRAPSRPEHRMAGAGVMRLLISVHPHDPQSTPADYTALIAKGGGNYTRMGAPDRERYYFRRAILGADRLIDYVCANTNWDGKHCVISGHSQGGGFALFMAGFNRHITACAAEEPALCDHAGYLLGRGTGWPNLASYQKAETQDATRIMSGYFDAVFFARRIKVPAVFAVGFLDPACPPSSVYAAYNLVEAPKRMFNQPRRGHMSGKSAYSRFVNGPWLRGKLGLGVAVAP